MQHRVLLFSAYIGSTPRNGALTLRSPVTSWFERTTIAVVREAIEEHS